MQHCKWARERRTNVKGTPLIFRSKACQPLSPKTPSIIIDLLQRFDDDNSFVDEKSLYISFYDSTIRFSSLDFDWTRRLSNLINLSDHAKGTRCSNKVVLLKPEEIDCQMLKVGLLVNLVLLLVIGGALTSIFLF